MKVNHISKELVELVNQLGTSQSVRVEKSVELNELIDWL